MARARDTQRSRVYAWEAACIEQLAHSSMYDAEFETLEECTEFATPIWAKERGRVGLARKPAPAIERPHRGQRRGIAHADHRITLPKWTRSRWYILHELAHRLNTKESGSDHGPRFVGILIGLIARWMDYDATQLMALADERGIKYSVRSIGVVPVRGPVWHVERVARLHGPMTEMDLACHLSLAEGIDITPPQVRGAALHLIKCGRARWLRHKLVLIGDAAPAPVAPPAPPKAKGKAPRTFRVQAQELAEKHEMFIDVIPGGSILVYPPDGLYPNEGDDPHCGDHSVEDWGDALKRVKFYVNAVYPGGPA